MKRRFLNFLICVDQLLFSIVTLGHASPDETISAGLWRMELAGKRAGKLFRPVVDALFWFDPEHCRMSYESERMGSHLPKHYR